MATYLRRFQNTVPLKSQNWTDFMARHPRYANGAWNWVSQCEKRGRKKSFLFPFLCKEEQRGFLPLCWHCFGLSFPEQPSETNLYILDKNSHFTHKADEISQIIGEYMGLTNVVIHEAGEERCHSWWINLIKKVRFPQQVWWKLHFVSEYALMNHNESAECVIMKQTS